MSTATQASGLRLAKDMGSRLQARADRLRALRADGSLSDAEFAVRLEEVTRMLISFEEAVRDEAARVAVENAPSRGEAAK